MHHRPALVALLLASGFIARADGPSDNVAAKVRQVPPPGIAIPAADRTELEQGVAALGDEIHSLRSSLKSKPALLELLPDVEVFHKAVQWALLYNEFYKTSEVREAREELRVGRERAEQLRDGKPAWTAQTGLVVRGYRSRIDGSVQPYGLVVPGSFVPDGPAHRLDFWFHGRGENLTELDFINGRLKSPGEFTPRDAFVLHVYGRYCNGSRFAGETDAFEALEHVRKHYPIDQNRILVRGFSLGGASCWDMATHHAGLWAAAAPGAGFSETADFLKVYQREDLAPTWYEKKLWHLYDAVDYAVNLFNCPTVAYSGELDGQKQAADMMDKALAAEGMKMTHIIGPGTHHAYHPAAKIEINRRIDAIASRGRNPVPDHVKFTTWTLRYNRMLWVRVDRLGRHWERARVDAAIDTPSQSVRVSTTNVLALTLIMDPGTCPLDNTRAPHVVLDDQSIEGPPIETDRSWTAHFKKSGVQWSAAGSDSSEGLEKRHGLQGPIDDAFMDSFVMVKPTGHPMNDKIGAWTTKELDHALTNWRLEYRGDAPVVNDDDLTAETIASSNLVLWGDPRSNKVLAKILGRLPIRWDGQKLTLGAKTFDSGHNVPVLIFPNPLNPAKYVVLNSGFTFREYDYLNNARQVPKLPDYAIVDIDTPVSSRAPGAVADAGFFGEKWEITEQP